VTLRDRIKPWFQDLAMGFMDPMRADTVREAHGEVLEIGFGTGRNLRYYSHRVSAVHGVDPMPTQGLGRVENRIGRAPFRVERFALSADQTLPFDAGRFDSVITTWTLCSIPDATAALSEMQRVLRPGGRYFFLEHGRGRREATIRWQERLNPLWNRLTDGCNINRPIDDLVRNAGFALDSVEEFEAAGPSLTSHMYRGAATRV
jgi:ubiquinone/menaquinone biosynthesis C-methylase UbiE